MFADKNSAFVLSFSAFVLDSLTQTAFFATVIPKLKQF